MGQEPDENKATGTCTSARHSASDSHFLPVNAAKLTQLLIGLSDEQHQVLEKELNRIFLVLRFSPDWRGQITVNTICDAIATFFDEERRTSRRRRRMLQMGFLLDHYQDIGACKRAIKLAYCEAFAHTPDSIVDSVAVFGAAGFCSRHQQVRYSSR